MTKRELYNLILQNCNDIWGECDSKTAIKLANIISYAKRLSNFKKYREYKKVK